MTTTNTIPLVCDPGAFQPAEREQHLEAGYALRSRVRGYSQIVTGLEIYFDPATSASEIENWALQERRCCAWIHAVRVRSEKQRVVLDLETSPDGAANLGCHVSGGSPCDLPSGRKTCRSDRRSPGSGVSIAARRRAVDRARTYSIHLAIWRSCVSCDWGRGNRRVVSASPLAGSSSADNDAVGRAVRYGLWVLARGRLADYPRDRFQ